MNHDSPRILLVDSLNFKNEASFSVSCRKADSISVKLHLRELSYDLVNVH